MQCLYKNIRCLTFFLAGLLLFVGHPDEILAQEAPQKKILQVKRSNNMAQNQKTNIGKLFPEVKSKSLAKNIEIIPDSAKGKVTLIAVAFLRESQSQLDSWLEPFTKEFGNNKAFMFYEIPMISSGYKFMRFIIDRGMRSGIPEPKHKHVVTLYGDVEKYINELGLDPSFGYAFLLDKKGRIQWQAEGFSTPEMLDELFVTAKKLSE
jgi:hypothetical protein